MATASPLAAWTLWSYLVARRRSTILEEDLVAGYSTVSVNCELAAPTARMTKRIFPLSLAASITVRKVNPGPPESESVIAQVPAEKSAVVPAHNTRLVPAVWFPNDSFRRPVVALTGAPVTRYLPLIPTVPVIVVTAKACFAVTASNAKVTRTIPTDRWKRANGPEGRSVKSDVM